MGSSHHISVVRDKCDCFGKFDHAWKFIASSIRFSRSFDCLLPIEPMFSDHSSPVHLDLENDLILPFFVFQKCKKIQVAISSIFLLVFWLEIDSMTAKTYIPQKSWFQWICSKLFGLWHGHNYFWPPWLWRLLEAKNVIAGAHFGTQLNVPIIPQCHFCLPKEIKSNPNLHQ